MNTFFRDISDLPDPDENTPPIDVTPEPLLSAHGAVIVVEMLHPNGVPAGKVMRGSMAHRALLEGGFYEAVQAQS
jgi:hypothetical protein